MNTLNLAVYTVGQSTETGAKKGVLSMIKDLKNIATNFAHFYLVGLTMSFLIIYFSFRFYFTWWFRHIMKHFTL